MRQKSSFVLFLSFIFVSCFPEVKVEKLPHINDKQNSGEQQAENLDERTFSSLVGATEKELTKIDNISIGDTLQGRIVKINDGDTYQLLLNDNQTVRIRMEGIDAPEGGMPYYRVSKKYLTNLAANAMVKSVIIDIDHYNRFVCRTYLDRKELSAEMLKSGIAWHYKKYNRDENFARLESEARAAGLGLWKEKDPVPPWIHRRLRRQGISTKELREFSLKTFELSDENPSILFRGFKVKKNKTKIEIYRNDDFIQTLEPLPKMKNNAALIHFADYNMDGHMDIMVKINNGVHYFFYNNETDDFAYRKDWTFEVWKMNKPKKQILSVSTNTPYTGSVQLFQIEDDKELQLLRTVKFDEN